MTNNKICLNQLKLLAKLLVINFFLKMMDFESEVCVLPNTSLHIIPVKKGFDQYTVQICE